ncbi:hypothetical protein OH76DRAFT_939196 [Lentinus brumalis]|uniref:Uncharacterized protein n=1 Tax=Lentinus brumalis TaxID=2498619 RepID=A0A371CZF4_9APHY|nr:hypothetical protein OH76DRAFT_939196 [Polyporus brumalis]
MTATVCRGRLPEGCVAHTEAPSSNSSSGLRTLQDPAQRERRRARVVDLRGCRIAPRPRSSLHMDPHPATAILMAMQLSGSPANCSSSLGSFTTASLGLGRLSDLPRLWKQSASNVRRSPPLLLIARGSGSESVLGLRGDLHRPLPRSRAGVLLRTFQRRTLQCTLTPESMVLVYTSSLPFALAHACVCVTVYALTSTAIYMQIQPQDTDPRSST